VSKTVLLIDTAEAFMVLCSLVRGMTVQVFSYPLELPEDKTVMAVYSPELEDLYEWVCLEMPRDQILELIHTHYPLQDSIVVVHGLKEWLKHFSSAAGLGIDSPNFRCTRLLAYLLDPPEKAEDETEADLTLQALVERYLEATPYPLWGVWVNQYPYPEVVYHRLWEDARYTYLLWQKLRGGLHSEGDGLLLDLYHHLELPFMRVLLDMELRGVRVDGPGAAAKLDEMVGLIGTLEKQITSSVGSWVDPNKPSEVRPFFSQMLGQPFIGPCDDDAFLVLQDRHPGIRPMLEYRKTLRDLNFLKMASETPGGRVHPHYHQCRIATGRVSITEPALQNIRKELREKYLLPEPGHLLVEADYRQAEARILAYFSRDPRLTAIFQDDSLDVFDETARNLNEEFRDSGLRLTRDSAKTLFYAVTYGAAAGKVAQTLGIDEDLASLIIHTFKDELYGRVGEFIYGLREHLIKLGRKGRYLETPWGRRRMFERRLMSLYDTNQPQVQKDPVRDSEIRKAFNFLLQGTVVDLIKQVQLRLDTVFRECAMGSRVILNLHDGLYLTVPDEEYPNAEDLVSETMESSDFVAQIREYTHADIEVPLRAKVKIL
jgi:DNA polymerase I-like protein with 3'-5' exonuclease and polymerase domains